MAAQARLKVAAFTVHATALQSARWKQAAEAEGYASIGGWAAMALDAYLENRKQAGKPLPMFWSRGHFRVRLEDGGELDLPEIRCLELRAREALVPKRIGDLAAHNVPERLCDRWTARLRPCMTRPRTACTRKRRCS